MKPAQRADAAQVRVVSITEFRAGVGFAGEPITLVVDARGRTSMSSKVLARLAITRRALQACGGELILVASPAMVSSIRRRGFQRLVSPPAGPADPTRELPRPRGAARDGVVIPIGAKR